MTLNNVRNLVKEGKVYLEQRGIDSPLLDAELFMSEALGVSRMSLLLEPDREVTEAEKKRYFEMLEKRGKNVPAQYILGRCEFMSLDFCVNENVLIPRPDTEILVETVLEKAKETGINSITDIGTGSGCIAVSLAKYGIDRVKAVDISPKALETAAKNAALNGIADKIEFLQADALSPNFEINNVDAVVSNPPYIETDIIPTLMKEVKDYEPMNALDGGSDGLVFYRAITKSAAKGLKKGGYVFYEIGYNQGKAVSDILKAEGFEDINIVKDLSGLDRVVYGRK